MPMLKILKKQQSKLDSSIKYAFSDNNNNIVEAVYFIYEGDVQLDHKCSISSICVSSQIGCQMKCDFCATGELPFKRNLSCSEMLQQTELIQNDLTNIPPITSYTLMGMGEPLLNFDAVVEFYIRGIKKQGLQHMSLSTVGIADKIVDLANINEVNYELFVSLHSPFDKQRNLIMPINKKYNIDEVIKASKYYVKKKNIKANMSYLLLDNVNDSLEHIDELTRILDKENFIIQLLLYNPHSKSKYHRPDEKKALLIKDRLQEKGYQVNIIISKAKDIAGGCGQLAGKL